jgi:hypothetical protein
MWGIPPILTGLLSMAVLGGGVVIALSDDDV